MDTQFIEVDGFKVNYLETGSGEPVILIHGLGGSWEDWVETISLLSPSFRVCALDLPGFGMSPPPANLGPEYNLGYVADFVMRFMDARGYPQAYMIGNSMGGGITLRCAIDYPARIKGIVLANGIGLGKEISGFNRLMAFPGAARVFLPFVTHATVVEIWRSLFSNDAAITQAMIERTWEWIRKPETKKFLSQLYPRALSIWGQKFILLPELGKIRCPSLVAWGINDSVLPVIQAVRAYQGISGAQFCLLRNCGHVPQIEQADLFNQAALRFLAEAL